MRCKGKNVQHSVVGRVRACDFEYSSPDLLEDAEVVTTERERCGQGTATGREKDRDGAIFPGETFQDRILATNQLLCEERQLPRKPPMLLDQIRIRLEDKIAGTIGVLLGGSNLFLARERDLLQIIDTLDRLRIDPVFAKQATIKRTERNQLLVDVTIQLLTLLLPHSFGRPASPRLFRFIRHRYSQNCAGRIEGLLSECRFDDKKTEEVLFCIAVSQKQTINDRRLVG